MSIYINQHNDYRQIVVGQKSNPLTFLDMFVQSTGNGLLVYSYETARCYFIIVETKILQKVQVYLEAQSNNPHLRFQFKPIRLITLQRQLTLHSQRYMVQTAIVLQRLNLQTNFRFYKWFINNRGTIVVEIVYLVENFSSLFHAQYILTQTLRQLSSILDLVLLQVLPYLNLQNLFKSIQKPIQSQKNIEDEEKSPSLLEKFRYMSLLNEVYKNHRNKSNMNRHNNSKPIKQNHCFTKLQTFTKTDILVHSDTLFIQQLERHKQQLIGQVKKALRLLNPSAEKKQEYLQMSKMHKVQLQFEQYVKSIKKEQVQIYEMTSTQYRIVKGIQNHTLVNKEKTLSDEGSHSVIYIGTYKIHLSDTLFTYQHFELKEEEPQKKVIVKPLITKRVKNQEYASSVNSFKNEVDFLYHVKDKRSKFIATYFLPIDRDKQEVKQIFSQFYPSNLKQYLESKKFQTNTQMGLCEILDIAQNILLALIFMVDNGVLHRDLKPFNVMMDENMKSRVIDFGSCCPVINWGDFSVSQKRILTTAGYQVRYKECPDEIRKKYSRKEYEQHILYDIYSFGSSLKEMMGYLPELDLMGVKENINVEEMVEMLVHKCKELDPIERATFDELLYYIRLLKETANSK